METLMFAFGVLTMVLVAIAAIAVYSTVKVLKLKRSLEMQDRGLNESISNLYRSNSQLEEHLHRIIDERSRDMQDQNNQIRHEISHRDETTNRRVNELNSYVDRRFDKLIDTYFAVKEAEEQTKKLIKG
jgi:C4-dicarboxylate-specific signal transduction histidine kinase